MKILQLGDKVPGLATMKTLTKVRWHATCTECKTSFEADWTDLEGFIDPESLIHVHCPVCFLPHAVEVSEDILSYLRSFDGVDTDDDLE